MNKLTQFMTFFVFLSTTVLLSLGLLFVVVSFSYGITKGANFAWISKGHSHPQSETTYSSIKPKTNFSQYSLLSQPDFYQPNDVFVDSGYLGFGEGFSINLAKGF